MTETMSYVVNKQVTVEASQERAFEVFVERFASWWPLDSHHIGKVDAESASIEPREGGRLYEQGVDGSECDWGRVLAYEPPSRLVIAWMLNADWEFDPDLAHATEVEVRFVPEGPATTRVELEHRGFERLLDRGKEVYEAVGGEGGWGSLLKLYAEAARSSA